MMSKVREVDEKMNLLKKVRIFEYAYNDVFKTSSCHVFWSKILQIKK